VALGAGLAALLTPLLVDVAQWVLSPLERRSAGRYVATATKRLQEVAPIVVGITGSYGKTSTKGYITALVAGDRRVVASPRSFNNRAGLARTVNDYLPDGTEVLVAEMGTYGPGEIAALCSWMPPRIAVFTAIGPVHLERFGSLDRILAAKAEIAIEAELVVCNVDDERLARLAAVLASQGKRVIGASAGAAPGAEVVVTGSPPELRLVLRGVELGTVRFEAGAWPTGLTNVACAVAVADELGVPGSKIMSRLSGLPVAANRLEWLRAPSGTIVLDDTFNSNPAGARRALEALERAAPAGPAARVVVTPGMVELGTRQFDENAQFGELAGRVASHLVIVGRTNRAALVAGARRAPGANVVLVDDRAEAVAWVRRELGEGTAVLYENDLPDHFP
jgi:UDP-N-acetylmuramoyl-tripeptide--D-alanyl-D-alanine ligase